MYKVLSAYAVILILFHEPINGHGFGGNTYVRTSAEYWARIEELVEYSDIQSVMSYCYDAQKRCSHKILVRARSTTNCYFDISFDEGDFSSDIACSPFQQFYLPEKCSWAPAHALQVGDVLLSEHEGNIPITHIKLFEYRLNLYALKIEHPHTFFVGRHSVLTHNMNLPETSACWHLPLTISTMSMTGGLFTGCLTLASGIAVSAIAASLIYSAVMDYKSKKYHKVEISNADIISYKQNILGQNILSQNVRDKEAKLPRKGSYPFIPKKTKNGKIPRDRDGGFIDKRGRSWIWDPKKEEWDVQVNGGRQHINVNTSGEETH